MNPVRRGHEEAGQEKARQEGAGQVKTVGQEEICRFWLDMLY